MSVTAATLRQARTMRLELDATVGAVTRDLAKAWSDAWEEIADEWADAVDDLIAAGDWPTRSQVLRAKRAQRAMAATVEALNDLAQQSGVRILRDVSQLADAAAGWELALATTQIPAGLTLDWARLDAKALAAIVKRTTGQVEANTRPLPREQQAVMKQVLIRGIAVGGNPKTAARLMLDRLGGAFDGGRARAVNIARTEMLDAHREASRQARAANPGVVAGWTWMATLDRRTCPACLAQHGTTYPADTFGPEGHQQCRCCALPTVKTWRELGIDLDEPASRLPDAHAWFDQQPKAVQAEIMGAERLRRLNSGELAWGDLAVRRQTPGWRDSYVVRPLAA